MQKEALIQNKSEAIKPLKKYLEEVPVKRMDRPSATETKRGRASETGRRKSEKNMEMPLK